MRDRVAQHIVNGGPFGPLALELFAWQRARNPEYAAFCGSAVVSRWQDIPAVPVALFRDLAYTCFPPAEAGALFRTSGTTAGRRGVHRMRDTRVYDLGALRHAELRLGTMLSAGVSLVSQAPDSSLGHMCQHFVPNMPGFFSGAAGLDRPGAWAALRAARQPVFVPGTAFAFAELVADEPTPCPLPLGSIVMVTGGFKGRVMTVSEDALVGELARLFPGARLVGEYGMTELSSQLWSEPLGDVFHPPPWMRVRAVDPWTGASATRGLLRFYDLANCDSVLAIETSDLGEVGPDGSVRLLGRLAGARARGCSLSAEEALHRAAPVLGAVAQPALGPPVPSSSSDAERIARVISALVDLAAVDPTDLSQGLSGPTARAGLHAACAAIDADGLAQELATPGRRPTAVAVVVAHGVFTSPIEWVALFAAAGARVLLKAPSADPAFCHVLADCFQAHDLDVHVTTDRGFTGVDAVVAFGDDDTMTAIADAHPQAVHALYGHRFSVAVVSDDPSLAELLAEDSAMYDGRGCMAPVAVFVVGGGGALADALPVALSRVGQRWPAGPVEPAIGPEWRRRLGLAGALGAVHSGAHGAVVRMPLAHFVPFSLPRMIVVHAVDDVSQVADVLEPWTHHLSSLVTDLGPGDGRWAALRARFPRVVSPGDAQRPAFPRAHDGRPMLGSVLR